MPIHHLHLTPPLIVSIHHHHHSSLTSFIITTHTHRHPSPFITIHYHSPWSIISYHHTIVFSSIYHLFSPAIIHYHSSSFIFILYHRQHRYHRHHDISVNTATMPPSTTELLPLIQILIRTMKNLLLYKAGAKRNGAHTFFELRKSEAQRFFLLLKRGTHFSFR